MKKLSINLGSLLSICIRGWLGQWRPSEIPHPSLLAIGAARAGRVWRAGKDAVKDTLSLSKPCLYEADGIKKQLKFTSFTTAGMSGTMYIQKEKT